VKRNAVAFAAFLLIPVAAFWVTCGSPDVDERVAARPGGELYVDLTLGKGFSFDKGSLVVTSHEANEVRVVGEASGWGEYAVDIDVREVDGGVRVVGKVEGLLHWMFGGPTVDLRVYVPRDYQVDARIDGGPLLLEDLVGPIVARVESPEETKLLRAEGDIQIILDEGTLRAEDVTGRLEIEARDGRIYVSGLEGALQASTRNGTIQVESVQGAVDLEVQQGSIEVEGVRGRLRAKTNAGRIELEDIEGDVEVATSRGRIDIEELDGQLLARSGRGRIEVEFIGAPAGNIETERGAIEIEVPHSEGFELEARSGRGAVRVDRELALVARATPRDIGGELESEDLAELGEEIATQMTQHVKHSVTQYLQQGFRTGNWEWDPQVGGAWRWDDDEEIWVWDPESNANDQRSDADDGQGARPAPPAERPTWPLDGVGGGLEKVAERGEWDGFDGLGDDDDRRAVSGSVNGGGSLLRLRSGRGAIHVRER